MKHSLGSGGSSPRQRIAGTFLGAIVLSAGVAGCSPAAQGDCQAGTERCACASNDECFAGLACYSGRCVDPNWRPEDGTSSGSDRADTGVDEESGDSSGPNNESACRNWIDGFVCGDFDLSDTVDCSDYASVDCDITGYFSCLEQATTCREGVPDTSGWPGCADRLECASDSPKPEPDSGDGSDTGTNPSSDGGGTDGGNEPGQGGSKNVARCKDFVDNYEDCPGGLLFSCEPFESYDCSLQDYFDCMDDVTMCVDGIIDSTPWSMCTRLLSC